MLIPDLEKLKEPHFRTVTGLDGHGDILFMLYKLYDPFLGDHINSTITSFLSAFKSGDGFEISSDVVTYYTLDSKLIGFVSSLPTGIGTHGISGVSILTIPNMNGYGVNMIKHFKQFKRIAGFSWLTDMANYPSCKLLHNLGGVIVERSITKFLTKNGSMQDWYTSLKGACLVDNAAILKAGFEIDKKHYDSIRNATDMYIEREVKPLYEKWLKNVYSKRTKLINEINSILTKRNLM